MFNVHQRTLSEPTAYPLRVRVPPVWKYCLKVLD
jgi:hypothetical protein